MKGGFPDARALAEGLSSLGLHGESGSLRIVARQENDYASTHPTEIVVCRGHGSETVRLFCKYGPTQARDQLGRRAGVGYESEVYRHLLMGQDVAPRFWGALAERGSGRTWLVLEAVGEACPLDLAPRAAVIGAGALLGRFQRTVADRAQGASESIIRHGAGSYGAWAERTLASARRWSQQPPWLAAVCERYRELVDVLLSVPATVVHGQYTPSNVLWSADRVHAVDWEEAAIGAGEIDLAAVIDDWPEPDVARRCVEAYREARWGGDTPATFATALGAARLFWALRWLGDDEELASAEAFAAGLLRLHRLAGELSLL